MEINKSIVEFLSEETKKKIWEEVRRVYKSQIKECEFPRTYKQPTNKELKSFLKNSCDNSWLKLINWVFE